MNKYERKVCQKAEYYRMTGVRYRFGFKAIVRYMLFISYHLCGSFANVNKKKHFFGDLFYIRCQENMAWKFP